jgi:hypothetical protein
MLLVGALGAALALNGCSVSAGPGLPCDLPQGAALVELPDGGYQVVEPSGASYTLAFANGVCVLSARELLPPRVERTATELGFVYDYYVLSLGPCLDHGGVPFLLPPSRERFVESGGNWSPYDAVFTGYLDADEIAVITTVCPPLPGPMASP